MKPFKGIFICRKVKKTLRSSTDCWFTLIILLFVLEILKKEKKALEKSSENDQSTGHFLSFFFFFSAGHFQSFFFAFFRLPNPKSEKNIPVNQLIKITRPYYNLNAIVKPYVQYEHPPSNHASLQSINQVLYLIWNTIWESD